MKRVATLIGGPQDGAKIVVLTVRPMVVFVGRKWLGDGKAAWSRNLCERFPVRYDEGKNGDYYFVPGEVG